MIIECVAFDSEESQRLMAELCSECDRIYGNARPTPSALTGMDLPAAAFLIAREVGAGIGCVALRPRSREIAEVKRMYVQPASRRAGAGRILMEKLEQIARENGFREVWLETGLGQPAAIRFYECLGYERIASFGDYAHDPVSVCYGKRLA